MFSGSLVDGMKSISDDTSEWYDSSLLTLESSLVGLGLEGRSKFNFLTGVFECSVSFVVLKLLVPSFCPFLSVHPLTLFYMGSGLL